MTDDRIERGRAAFARRAWAEAFDLLAEADRETPLALEDLEKAGSAAQYSGHDEVAVQLAGRLHRASLEIGDFARAARMAFWIGMAFLQRGDVTQGGGWLGRASHLLDEHELDTVERGYLRSPRASVAPSKTLPPPSRRSSAPRRMPIASAIRILGRWPGSAEAGR